MAGNGWREHMAGKGSSSSKGKVSASSKGKSSSSSKGKSSASIEDDDDDFM